MTGQEERPERGEAMQALQALLDAHGADPARWPAADPRRAAAWALIRSGDEAAARAVAAAKALDRALDTAIPPAPSAALAGAVLQAAARPVRPGFGTWAGRFWKPVGALACAGLLGITVGLWSPVPVAGVGDRPAAGLAFELASLGALDIDGGDNADGFGDFAE